MEIRRTVILVLSALALTFKCHSAEIPHEKILPSDTLVFATIPDYNKAVNLFNNSAGGMFLKDPSMKAFIEKFSSKWHSDVVVPLEKELGIKFADYSGIVNGQVSFALNIAPGNESAAMPQVAVTVLIESREGKENLTKAIQDIKQKYSKSGGEIKSAKVGNTGYDIFVVNSEAIDKIIDKVFPDPTEGWESLDGPKPKKENKKYEISVCQLDSLLILSTKQSVIEKLITNASGNSPDALANYENFKNRFQKKGDYTTFFAWFRADLLTGILKILDALPKEEQSPFDPLRILKTTGILSIKDISLIMNTQPEGGEMEIFGRLPKNELTGFLKALVPQQKDSTPPSFVPANSASFVRYRLDFQQTWTQIENVLNQIDPKIISVLNLMLQTAGRAKDPNFDWKKNIIGNLGDDLIVYTKIPEKVSFENINRTPRIVLLNSKNPDELGASIRFLSALSPKPPEIKEKDIAGKKVYYWQEQQPPLEMPIGQKQNPPQRFTYISSVANYTVFANDQKILEEFLNFSESKANPLKNLPGFNEALNKAGNQNSGLILFSNDRENMRMQFNVLKNEPDTVAAFIGITPIGMRLGLAEDSKVFKEWIDASLLPDFEKVAKYFNFTLSSLTVTDDGIMLKSVTPNSPELKK